MENFEVEISTNKTLKCKNLTFTHKTSNISLIFKEFKETGNEFTNQNGKLINSINSQIYHAVWLEENIQDRLTASRKEGVDELEKMDYPSLIKIMRYLREWRSVNDLNFPSEIIDICIYYSTSYFKQFNILQVIIKFFALVNLLINPYNYYFYELSEYHSFMIKVNFSKKYFRFSNF